MTKVIRERFGTAYHVRYVGRLLKKLGFSRQRPAFRATQRDEQAIARLAAHQKKARRRGGTVVFVDETGFLLRPSIDKTWAPRVQTPIFRASGRQRRLSAIGAVTLSPRRKRINLF